MAKVQHVFDSCVNIPHSKTSRGQLSTRFLPKLAFIWIKNLREDMIQYEFMFQESSQGQPDSF